MYKIIFNGIYHFEETRDGGKKYHKPKNMGKYIDPVHVLELLKANHRAIILARMTEAEKASKNIQQDGILGAAIKDIARWIAWQNGLFDAQKGLFLVGGVGCGKTCLILAVQQTLQQLNDERAFGFKVMKDISLIFQISRNYLDLQVFYSRNWCIDDIGYAEETVIDYGNRINLIDTIICQRYVNGNRSRVFTYTTTNLSKSEMSARYDSRTIDRFYEMCNLVDMRKIESFRKNK
jgi:DNA replication protein DnaC